MIPLEEAQEFVLSRCSPLESVELPISDALMSVTAERVAATEQVPAFDNTAMDGYAVRAADTHPAPSRLRVVGTLAAGESTDVPLESGQAIRIMTGAPIPPGSDAVVMVERTREIGGGARDGGGSGGDGGRADGGEGGGEGVDGGEGRAGSDGGEGGGDGDWVELEVSVPPGNHLRRAGEDLQPGQVLFEAGCILRPAHIGALAGLGLATVRVTKRARVGVMSTGDELVDVPGPLAPGQVRDANRCSLLSLVAVAGAEPVDLGLARDDADSIREMIRRGVETCDAVVTSGGVSMGTYDLVKMVLDEMGEMAWMQVAIRPAKPLAFGLVEGVPVFGLPGNTVSCMVSFELFARPALWKMMGRSDLDGQRVTAAASEPLRRRADGKVHFARVLWQYCEGRYEVRSAGGQGSHQLSAMAAANGLAVLPDGEGVDAGEQVELICLHS